MPYHLIDLDADTRRYMLSEFDRDVSDAVVFSSAVVDPGRAADYLAVQRRAFESGTPESLSDEFLTSGMLVTRQANGAIVNGPAAARRLAAGQFGAYYARAVSVRALGTDKEVEVYRARASTNLGRPLTPRSVKS